MFFAKRYATPSILKQFAMGLYWPALLFIMPVVFFAFSPLLLPLGILASVAAVVIGGNPIPYTMELLADAGPRVKAWLGTLGPRWLDSSPPHPSYSHIGEFPTIENVPSELRWQFSAVRGPTYLRKMFTSLFLATYYALFNYKIRPMDDEEMGRIAQRSTYIKFFNRVDKIPTWATEAGVKQSKSDRVAYYIVDCSFLNCVKTYPGMHSSSTISLWRGTERGDRPANRFADMMSPRRPSDFIELLPIAIFVQTPNGSKYVTRPGDAAWDGAKTFVQHGCSHLGSLRDHPKIHFPYVCDNFITELRFAVK
jgi:hypothetical protein